MYENSHGVGYFETTSDPLDYETPAQYQVDGEVSIDLDHSQGYDYFFSLDDHRALGCSYSWYRFDPEAVKYFRLGPEPSQMAIWDYRSGERLSLLKSHHFGKIEGACLDHDGRLLTWAQDYCVKQWDLGSGEELKTLTLPLFSDENNQAKVAKKSFSALSIEEKMSYLVHRDRPAPHVTILWKLAPSSSPKTIHISGQAKLGGLKAWPPSIDGKKSHLRNLCEQDGVAAGYSTAFLLADGRLASAGTTCGANGIIYVWDGLLDLTIIFTGYSYDFCLSKGANPNSLEYWEDLGDEEPGRKYCFQL